MCSSAYCYKSAERTACGIPMCQGHYDEIEKFFIPPPPRLKRERAKHVVPISWVYYVGWPDRDMIKIGVSQKLSQRLRNLRLESPAHLLALEPGGYRDEQRRHKQFVHLRKMGTELFMPDPELLEHIEKLKRSREAWRKQAHVAATWLA
jgi:hypothetical protein